MSIDPLVVDSKDIVALGIKISPTHRRRLMKAGKFPQCFKQTEEPKSRVLWWFRDITKWLQDRSNHSSP